MFQQQMVLSYCCWFCPYCCLTSDNFIIFFLSFLGFFSDNYFYALVPQELRISYLSKPEHSHTTKFACFCVITKTMEYSGRNELAYQKILKIIPWKHPFHWIIFNSLRPSDAIWWYRSGSTLAQVMAWCLTAPSHYLNQCWQIISEVIRHLHEGNFTGTPQTSPWYDFKNY